MRRLSWHGWKRRRTWPGDHESRADARRSGFDGGDPRWNPGCRNAVVRDADAIRVVGSRALPAHAAAAKWATTTASVGDDQWTCIGRNRAEPDAIRYAGAGRRWKDPSFAKHRWRLSQRYFAIRLAELQRHNVRQPVQCADADRQKQSCADRAQVDVQSAKHAPAAGHARCRRW